MFATFTNSSVNKATPEEVAAEISETLENIGATITETYADPLTPNSHPTGQIIDLVFNRNGEHYRFSMFGVWNRRQKCTIATDWELETDTEHLEDIELLASGFAPDALPGLLYYFANAAAA